MSPPLALRLVGRAGAPATAAAEAGRRIFPEALVTRTETLSEISAMEATGGPELLVLLSPSDADLQQAVTAVDSRGGPRWAVVASSALPLAADSHAIHVLPEDWSESVLALAFASAVRLHAFKAAHIHRTGDVRTISRRLGHDLRSPLNCIAASNEAMADPDEKPDSPRAAFGKSIAESVDEVVHLFDRISFVMKATTYPLPRQPAIMEEIVWGALQRIEKRMLQAQATVTQPPKWPVLDAVPAWCDVIWSNLLTNSLDHAGPAPRIELGWEQLPGEYRFWLRDSGPGVAEKQLPLLFHPLDRMSELNAPHGLGLSIVHRLVELQGGRCGHERAATGSGTFFFTLPSLEPSLPN